MQLVLFSNKPCSRTASRSIASRRHDRHFTFNIHLSICIQIITINNNLQCERLLIETIAQHLSDDVVGAVRHIGQQKSHTHIPTITLNWQSKRLVFMETKYMMNRRKARHRVYTIESR